MAKYATVSFGTVSKDLNLTLGAEYWVNKMQGRDPYFVQDGRLAVAKNGASVKGVIYLTKVGAVKYRKLLRRLNDTQSAMDALRAELKEQEDE